jgi:hypothetical protein
MLGTQLFSKAEQAEFAARRTALKLAGQFHSNAMTRLQEVSQILKERAASRNQVERGLQAEPISADQKAALDRAGSQLADALSQLQAHQPGPIVHVLGQARHPFIEQLKSDLQGMGFSAAQIFWFFSEMIRARSGISEALKSVRSGDDWSKLAAAFTSAADPHQWGFAHPGSGAVDPALQQFVSACRSVGITPSYFFLYCAAMLLAHGHEEASAMK